MAKFLRAAGVVGFTGGLCYGEKFLLGLAAEQGFGIATDGVDFKLPRLYGLVILSNVVLSTIVMLMLGFQSGWKRKEFAEKAKKDGDEHAEERFSYPKLYAEGFGKLSNDFNCVIRGHQNALETYPSFVGLSLVGGLGHPVLVALCGIVWSIARTKYASGYGTGTAINRYKASGGWGKHVWTTLLIILAASVSTSLTMLGIV